MTARTKEARLRRTLTVKDVNGHPVTFHLKRDWAMPQASGWGPTPRRQQVTVVTVGPQEDTKHPVHALVHYLWLLQSEQARAYIPQTPTDLSNIPMAVGKVRQDGTVEHPRWPVLLAPFPTFDGETARSVEAFINEFHLKHITGSVQKERVQQTVSKLGPARELKRIPIWEVNVAFPEPTATDGDFATGNGEAIVYDFPQSGRDELHFVWRIGRDPEGRAMVQRSELHHREYTSRAASNTMTVWAGRAEDEDGVEDLDATNFILIKRLPGERIWNEGNNSWVWPGMYVRVADLRLATAYQPMGFPMLGTVGLGDNATTEVSTQAIIEYMGKSKGEGAKLRFTVIHQQRQYVFNTTQKHLMTSRGDGVLISDGTTGWRSVHITVPHSLVSRILVALDKRIEEGLAGPTTDESILQPWRTRVIDTVFPDDQHIDIDLTPVGRVKVNIVHLVDGKVTQNTEYKTLARSEVHEMLQRERLPTPLGPAVLEGPESPWAYLVSDLERALVVFDRLEETGTPLDGFGASRPDNRITVVDVDGRKWQAKVEQRGGMAFRRDVFLGYRRMIGKNYDGWEERSFYAREFAMHPIVTTHPSRGESRAHVVVPAEWEQRTVEHEVDTERIPVLSEVEAARVLAFVQAYVNYFETGQNQLDYRDAKERKLGRSVQVATLPVWRNPVTGVRSERSEPDESLDVFVFPESGTDTVRLSSVGKVRREALYTHATLLAARYSTPFFRPSLEVIHGNPENLLLVYPFGLETYDDGSAQPRRVGLYALSSDVYNALWAGWQAHQKGWSQPDAGPHSMPNFPFEVEVLYGTNEPYRASARIEYMGKNKAGIPQFEVTVDAVRMAHSSLWFKKTGGITRPRTFYTDAKLLQRTPNLFESKELLKWQHSHNPDGKPEHLGPKTGTRLSPASQQLVLVALDARYESGLKGTSERPTFILYEKDDSGYPSKSHDVIHRIAMSNDGYPYVWLYRVADYHFKDGDLRPVPLEKPITVLGLSVFQFTDHDMVYGAFQARRLDGDKEVSSWFLDRSTVDALRAEICTKVKSGELKLGDWSRGSGPWCRPMARLEGTKAGLLTVAASLPGVPGVLLAGDLGRGPSSIDEDELCSDVHAVTPARCKV